MLLLNTFCKSSDRNKSETFLLTTMVQITCGVLIITIHFFVVEKFPKPFLKSLNPYFSISLSHFFKGFYFRPPQNLAQLLSSLIFLLFIKSFFFIFTGLDIVF